jgi:hypothetical protein
MNWIIYSNRKNFLILNGDFRKEQNIRFFGCQNKKLYILRYINTTMAFIYETKNFVLESINKPGNDRLEGGQIKITPKIAIEDRTKLTPKQAIELMRFTIVAGIALVNAMKHIGVDIGRINYQDNGNWRPTLHMLIYGRARDAKMQKYGEPIIPGHKAEYNPLNDEDIKRIKDELDGLFKQEKFSDAKWGL